MDTASKAYEELHNAINHLSISEEERLVLLHDLNTVGGAAFSNSYFSAQTIQDKYQEVYGRSVSEKDARKISRQATILCSQDEEFVALMDKYIRQAMRAHKAEH